MAEKNHKKKTLYLLYLLIKNVPFLGMITTFLLFSIILFFINLFQHNPQ